MKVIYSGLESSGKSLRLAMKAEELLTRNEKWLKESGIARTIASNLELSQDFLERAQTVGIPVKIWRTLDELVQLANCDVIIDEIGNYFDSRNWADLSLDVRSWLSQAAKCGVEIYGSAQDFAQVDKSFRRLVNELWHISKIIGSRRPSPTKPPVKKIWGVCSIKRLEPMGYDEDTSKFKSLQFMGIPFFFTIQQKYCEIFDTTQKIKKSPPMPFRHIERHCNEPGCEFCKTIHI